MTDNLLVDLFSQPPNFRLHLFPPLTENLRIWFSVLQGQYQLLLSYGNFDTNLNFMKPFTYLVFFTGFGFLK